MRLNQLRVLLDTMAEQPGSIFGNGIVAFQYARDEFGKPGGAVADVSRYFYNSIFVGTPGKFYC